MSQVPCGKVLNVFATIGGSDVRDCYNDLKKAYPQYNWGESRLMNIIKKSRSSSLVFLYFCS